ncbi:MAG: hypothetical protein JW395_4155 [Nitrospira sp.]|nr:hypothetical protein [Nitrospira sp.]
MQSTASRWADASIRNRPGRGNPFGAGAIILLALATSGTAGAQELGLPGDVKAFRKEVRCQLKFAQQPSSNLRGYLPAIGAAEHTDSVHSGVYPCATWTGSFDGANNVLQYVSDTTWASIQLVVFDGPEVGYLQGGGAAPPVYPGGQFIARFNASTGKQIWFTSTGNGNDPDQWIAFGSMGIHKNGYLYAAAGPNIYKMDRQTGGIIATAEMTVLGSLPTDANFDGFEIAPDKKGTILMKTQNRPVGCTNQGNAALGTCGGTSPNTTVVAVDPDTLETLDAIELPEAITARPIVTTYQGKIYLYMAGTTLMRVNWFPGAKKLMLDQSWNPAYVLSGQTGGTAPNVIGNWIISNTNAKTGAVPMSVVAVNQGDENKLVRINPWGTTLPTGVPLSVTVGSFGVDPKNSMIYAQDYFVGGVYGIKLNQKTGAMKVVWSRPDWRNSDYFTLVGPTDERVLISQYIDPNTTFADVAQGLAANQLTYTESVLWANAATGTTIAQSQYNPATALGSLPNMGYGGRIYMMGNQGSVYIYKPVPAGGEGGRKHHDGKYHDDDDDD